MKRRMQKSTQQTFLAHAEIVRFFALAASAPTMQFANRYVALARQIGMRFRLRLTSAQHRQFCKGCGTFLRPGVNCRVRVRDGKTRYTCLTCKRPQRIPYRRKSYS